MVVLLELLVHLEGEVNMFRGKDVGKTFKHHNFRKPMSRGKDPRYFSKTADRMRVENNRNVLYRGGTRF